jgi:glycosyltransferase involved in cell wall biosynthesis
VNNPVVSVLIPSYNHESYIEETIQSILNQTFQDFEIIITDDGSSDKTVDKIKNFSDPRIHLHVFKENQGACKALNNCILNSKGKYITYISSDDVWELNKLEKQLKYLEENPSIHVLFTKAKIIDENSNPYTNKEHPYYSVFDRENRSRAEWLNFFFYTGNCICHPSIMIEKTVYDDIGLYNERMANLPDLDMWVRLCLEYDFHILEEKLIKFRVRDDENNVSGVKPQTKIRSKFEKMHIFHHYLKIKDIKFLLKIFPDAEKFGKLEPDMVPYFLARLAYETEQDILQLWALNILFEFMQSNEVVDKLKKEYNFYYPDFLEMTAKGDFLKIIPIFNKNRALNEKNEAIIKRDEIIRDKNQSIARRNELLGEKEWLIKRMGEKNDKLISKIETLTHDHKVMMEDKNAQIEDLRSSLYIVKFKNSRKFIQSLLYKFPSLLILFNRKNTSFKNALINLKGYKSIKKNNLFDMGYYLKNNDDIRRSGKDPLIHYIYLGFKENRKPNPNFDAEYYLKTHPDVRNSNLNPLVHYSVYGIKEDRKINKKNRAYKVAIIIKENNGEYSPTSYVRLLLPLSHKYLKGKIEPIIITDKNLKDTKEEHILNNEYDCCIVQRDVLGDLSIAKIIVQRCREKNIGLIYEIDDDLLNIEESHPEYEFYTSRSGSVMYMLEHADTVTVSTEELKKRYEKYNKSIKVIGNALDENLWCKKSDKKSGETIKIGYIGSFTHDNDLLTIKDAIINIKKKFAMKNIEVSFNVIGVMKGSDKEQWINTINIPNNKKVYPEFVKWLKETVNFDFAIAPLADNNINKSKSELKYLEYTALGLPGIYSDNGPFSKVISNEINGLLVEDNSAGIWEDQISKMIENKKLRNKILDNAKKNIIENYLLKNRVKEWDGLISELTDEKKI